MKADGIGRYVLARDLYTQALRKFRLVRASGTPTKIAVAGEHVCRIERRLAEIGDALDLPTPVVSQDTPGLPVAQARLPTHGRVGAEMRATTPIGTYAGIVGRIGVGSGDMTSACHVNEAKKLLKIAVTMDNAGMYDMALESYRQALVSFTLAAQRPAATKLAAEAVSDSVQRIERRIHELSCAVNSVPMPQQQNGGSVEGAGFEMIREAAAVFRHAMTTDTQGRMFDAMMLYRQARGKYRIASICPGVSKEQLDVINEHMLKIEDRLLVLESMHGPEKVTKRKSEKGVNDSDDA